MEYRPLEGFVFAVSPFNFTAIAANLTTSAALMGNVVVWKPAGTAMVSAYYLMRLLQEAGLPDGVINLVYGSGATIGDAALASPHLAGIHFTGSTAVFNGMWRTVASNMERYRNYPRIVGETGGKDFIVAHPVRGRRRARDRDRPRLVRVPGTEVQRVVTRLRAVEPLAGAARPAAGRGRDDPHGRRLRLPQLHGRGDRRLVVRDAVGGDRRGEGGRGRRASSSAAATPTREGWFVEPTVIETREPRVPDDARGALRPGRDDVRLRRGEVGRHAAVDRPHRAVRPHRRRLLGGPRCDRRREAEAALRSGQLLRQRQADRRGRRPAAVRRRPRVGHERQGRLDVEPDPLGQPAVDQGDVHASARLPLPVHGRTTRWRPRTSRRPRSRAWPCGRTRSRCACPWRAARPARRRSFPSSASGRRPSRAAPRRRPTAPTRRGRRLRSAPRQPAACAGCRSSRASGRARRSSPSPAGAGRQASPTRCCADALPPSITTAHSVPW